MQSLEAAGECQGELTPEIPSTEASAVRECGASPGLGGGRRTRLLFVVEGYTDIRFVSLLSEISELTLLIPREHYRRSGLEQRLNDARLPVEVIEVPGARAPYQWASLVYLWRHAKRFDLILGQEMLRGSLNATLIGRVRGIPVVTYMCLPYAEYFRCRQLRGQISWPVAVLGETTIRALMRVNGRLGRHCIALGPYLAQIARAYSAQVSNGLYYGVDTGLYSPCSSEEKAALRRQLGLPSNKFLIFFSSRMSHEKDPETVLKAAARARKMGLDCSVLNLSGEHLKFADLARRLQLNDAADGVIAKPPAHPMEDLPLYYRAVDCLAQASLEEGLGMSPLEALASGLPAVCSSVGGLKANLAGRARLVPVRDSEAMAREFLWISQNPELARKQALAGRRYVQEFWGRERARESLKESFASVLRDHGHRNPESLP
jgi:glycosyltransferase involved in cell wall biosynthesis